MTSYELNTQCEEGVGKHNKPFGTTFHARPTNNKEDNNDVIIDDYDYDDGVMLDTETYLECSKKNTINEREDQEEIQKRSSYCNSNRQTKIPKFTTTSMIFDDKYSQHNANYVFDTPQMSQSTPKELLNNYNNAKTHMNMCFKMKNYIKIIVMNLMNFNA